MYTVGSIRFQDMYRWQTPARAYNCVGPKNGQPLCPCAMKGVEVRDGRYVRIQDLGPVKL